MSPYMGGGVRHGPAPAIRMRAGDARRARAQALGAPGADPPCMVRPCVARGFVDLAVSGLASMYPASDWSAFAPGHHGYQRACDLISGQASNGPLGSPVFACAGKTDPPSRLILSQTSAGSQLVANDYAT